MSPVPPGASTVADVGPGHTDAPAWWSHRDGARLLTLAALAVWPLALAFSKVGLPRVDLMWQFHRAGLVGPTCGLTRAAVALAGGDAARAWMLNPAVFLLAVAPPALAARAAVGIATCRWLVLRLPRHWSAAALAAALVAGLWANQQSHAALLLSALR